ncbi:MAG: hypothetical protein ACK56Q_10940 [Pirellulaceae bacterium]|jgi:hypothetical protein
MMSRCFLLSLLAVLFAEVAKGEIVTQWNFNAITPGNIATALPSTGVGSISLVGGTTTPTSGSAGTGSSDTASPNLAFQTTTYATQGTGNLSRGVQFAVSTVGYQDIQVTWDQRHSNTSSRFWALLYTTDGATWNTFSATGAGTDTGLYVGATGDTWFNQRTADLSGIAGVNDNPNFGIRIVASFAPGLSTYAASSPTGTYAAGGTARFDMLTINGTFTAIPEPSSVLLTAVAACGYLSRRPWRRKLAV